MRDSNTGEEKIVQRMTVRYKLGKTDEATALVKAEFERVVQIGPFLEGARFTKPWRDDQLGESEIVWEGHAQAEEMWGKWASDPGSKAFLDARVLLLEEGNKTEWLYIARPVRQFTTPHPMMSMFIGISSPSKRPSVACRSAHYPPPHAPACG
jgi:hypothetical protein